MAVILVVFTVGIIWQAVKIMNYITSEYYLALMDTENEMVEKVLYGVEVAVTNSIDDIEEQLQSPESVYAALKDELRCNPQLVGFFACFEAGYYPSQGRWFEPYAVWNNGKIDTMQIASDKNDYLQDDWYKQTFAADSGYWSEPYIDDAGSGRLLCSYSMPISDSKGRKIGVFGADVSLDMLQDHLAALDQKTNFDGAVEMEEKDRKERDFWSYAFIVDSQGTFIAHHDKKRILHDNFYEIMQQSADSTAHLLAREMKAGGRGKLTTEIDGRTCYAYYTPLEHTNWEMAIIVPQDVIIIPALATCLVIIVFIIPGLIAIYYICRTTIRRSTRPLQQLATIASEVAKGNFNSALPTLRHNDEIGQLRDAFSNMQQSLAQYIDELKITTAEKASFESELAIARSIQMAMLPDTHSSSDALHTSYDIHASLTPAKAVGGDLYDYFVRGDLLYFCVGDVSGKGVPAALVMAMVSSAFRLLAESETQPERIVTHMNDNIVRRDLEVFITLFVGVLDLKTGRLQYCNAGHKRPYIGAVALPVISNLPVGAMPDWTFKGQETVLTSGSTLFVFTDGLNEAEDAQHQQFGEERIVELLQTCSGEPCTLIEHMTQAVHAFVGDTEQNDDLTMLALHYTPTASSSPSN